MPYIKYIGSKYEVYKGKAKETSGGLKKKDIVLVKEKVRVYENNKKVTKTINRYKSKKQQNKKPLSKSQYGLTMWAESTRDALKELRKKDKYYIHNVLMKKPVSGKKSFTKAEKLYNKTREIYDSKKK